MRFGRGPAKLHRARRKKFYVGIHTIRTDQLPEIHSIHLGYSGKRLPKQLHGKRIPDAPNVSIHFLGRIKTV